jgi:hypothetical protein
MVCFEGRGLLLCCTWNEGQWRKWITVPLTSRHDGVILGALMVDITRVPLYVYRLVL